MEKVVISLHNHWMKLRFNINPRSMYVLDSFQPNTQDYDLSFYAKNDMEIFQLVFLLCQLNCVLLSIHFISTCPCQWQCHGLLLSVMMLLWSLVVVVCVGVIRQCQKYKSMKYMKYRIKYLSVWKLPASLLEPLRQCHGWVVTLSYVCPLISTAKQNRLRDGVLWAEVYTNWQNSAFQPSKGKLLSIHPVSRCHILSPVILPP